MHTPNTQNPVHPNSLIETLSGILVAANTDFDSWNQGQHSTAKFKQAVKYGVKIIFETALVARMVGAEHILPESNITAEITAPQPDHYGDF